MSEQEQVYVIEVDQEAAIAETREREKTGEATQGLADKMGTPILTGPFANETEAREYIAAEEENGGGSLEPRGIHTRRAHIVRLQHPSQSPVQPAGRWSS